MVHLALSALSCDTIFSYCIATQSLRQEPEEPAMLLSLLLQLQLQLQLVPPGNVNKIYNKNNNMKEISFEERNSRRLYTLSGIVFNKNM